MVSGVHSSISALLAANYSQIGQTASIQQIRADEAAAKARLQAEEALKAQTTIQPVTRDGRSPYQGALFGFEQRQQNLKDLSRPKPDISPSDEVQIFAAAEAPTTATAEPQTAETIFEQASDGVFYAVNDNSTQSAQSQAEAQRAQTTQQQKVADLYRRNFNARFETVPAYQLAA